MDKEKQENEPIPVPAPVPEPTPVAPAPPEPAPKPKLRRVKKNTPFKRKVFDKRDSKRERPVRLPAIQAGRSIIASRSKNQGCPTPLGSESIPFHKSRNAATIDALKELEQDGITAIQKEDIPHPIEYKEYYPAKSFDEALCTAIKPRKEISKDIEITVQPDFVELFKTVVSRVTKIDAIWPDIISDSISRPAIVGYCMMQLYVWLIMNELETSEEPSPHVKEWANDPFKREILEIFRRSPTLIIFEDIYVSLQPFQLQPNIRVIPTWKSFNWINDVGYVIPIHTFLYMHNLISTVITNRDPAHMERVMRTQPLVEATMVNTMVPNNTDTVIMNIGTMSGRDFQNFSSDNPTSQAFQTLVNFGTIRSIRRSSDITPYSIQKKIDVTVDENFNVLDYVLGGSRLNFKALEVLATNMTSFLSTVNYDGPTLNQRLKARLWNSNILQHTVKQYLLPDFYLKVYDYSWNEDVELDTKFEVKAPTDADKADFVARQLQNCNQVPAQTQDDKVLKQYQKAIKDPEQWAYFRGHFVSPTEAFNDTWTRTIHQGFQVTAEGDAPFNAVTKCEEHPNDDGAYRINYHGNHHQNVESAENDFDIHDIANTIQPTMDKFNIYRLSTHDRPKALAIRCLDGNTEQAIRSSLYGLNIYNSSVDGFFKHMPQPESEKDFESARISDSCIRMDCCINFTFNAEADYFRAKELQYARPLRFDETGLASQVICHDLSTICLPLYPVDAAIPQTINSKCFPGLPAETVNILDLPPMFYGYKSSNGEDRTEQKHESDISKNQKVMLWSAYRYVAKTRKKIATQPQKPVKFFISDLQSIVGADIQKLRVKDTSYANQEAVGQLPTKR